MPYHLLLHRLEYSVDKRVPRSEFQIKKRVMAILRLKNTCMADVQNFLSHHISTSMLMKINIKNAGLEGEGVHSGKYFGYVDSLGALQGIVALYWNGIIMSQCPHESHLSEIISSIISNCGEKFHLKGIFGPSLEVIHAKRALNLSVEDFSMDSIEALFELNLTDLKKPRQFNTSTMHIEHVGNFEKTIITSWIRAYCIEALKSIENDGFEAEVKEKVEGLYKSEHCYVLKVNGTPVSLCGFNAALPDIIQVGPVWTPVEFRGRGYAQSAVYLNLERVRNQELKQSVLFTDEANLAAIQCYKSLGFVQVGKYHVCFTKSPILISE